MLAMLLQAALQAAAASCKLQADFDSAESASGNAETNKQKDRSHHHQQAQPAPQWHCRKRQKDPVVMWPCWADPRSRKWLLQQMSEKGPLLSLPSIKKQTMQSSPCQPVCQTSQPSPGPITLSMHAHTHAHTHTHRHRASRPMWLGMTGQGPPTFVRRDA